MVALRIKGRWWCLVDWRWRRCDGRHLGTDLADATVIPSSTHHSILFFQAGDALVLLSDYWLELGKGTVSNVSVKLGPTRALLATQSGAVASHDLLWTILGIVVLRIAVQDRSRAGRTREPPVLALELAMVLL